MERLLMDAFPDALYDEAIERISRFTVGLSGIDVRQNAEVQYQSGTGTLVDLDGNLLVITADHVIEDICRRDRIGLLIDLDGGLRRCVFERDHLQYVRLPRGATPDLGPDLGAIVLPRAGDGLATLKANKVFYNLRRRILQFQGGYPALTDGVWFPCGILGEDSQQLPPERGFAHVNGHWAMVGLALAPAEIKRDGFDYLDVKGRPRVDSDMPESFGGASGGGLWHGLVGKSSDGRLSLCDVIFSGVIFYQSDVVAGHRTLRSHGRISLHERLVEAIKRASLGEPFGREEEG
jgi:hypothetical protein